MELSNIHVALLFHRKIYLLLRMERCSREREMFIILGETEKKYQLFPLWLIISRPVLSMIYVFTPLHLLYWILQVVFRQTASLSIGFCEEFIVDEKMNFLFYEFGVAIVCCVHKWKEESLKYVEQQIIYQYECLIPWPITCPASNVSIWLKSDISQQFYLTFSNVSSFSSSTLNQKFTLNYN